MLHDEFWDEDRLSSRYRRRTLGRWTPSTTGTKQTACGFWSSSITAVTRIIGSTGSANDVRHYLVVARFWAPSGPPPSTARSRAGGGSGAQLRWASYVPPDLATAMSLAVAARLAATPETNRHTSIHQRVEHAAARRKLERPPVAASRATASQERPGWHSLRRNGLAAGHGEASGIGIHVTSPWPPKTPPSRPVNRRTTRQIDTNETRPRFFPTPFLPSVSSVSAFPAPFPVSGSGLDLGRSHAGTHALGRGGSVRHAPFDHFV